MTRSSWQETKALYRTVLIFALPLIIQNSITNFVNMLDNIMVGQIGTEQMAGVAIVNHLLFVYNLCVFGGMSGAGIFTAQYFGNRDYDGVRNTFRFKFLLSFVLTIAAFLVLGGFGTPLIQLFLQGDSNGGDLVATLSYGHQYLMVMLLCALPVALTSCYATTLRECGETMLAMTAAIVAVFVNISLNYTLIFGHFGAPCLGVVGAAVATLCARLVELSIVVIGTHRNKVRYHFMQGIYRTLKIPKQIAKQIFVTGLPLLANEALWAGGMAMLQQCYSVRGLTVVNAFNISLIIYNVISAAFLNLGFAIGVTCGNMLGAGERSKAKSAAPKLIILSIGISIFFACLSCALAPYFPLIYKTTDEAKHLATLLMLIAAMGMPINACANSCYYIIRSGGKTWITFLFDSCFVWVIYLPIIYCLIHFSTYSILIIYTVAQLLQIIKCIIGGVMIKKGIWVNRIIHGSF